MGKLRKIQVGNPRAQIGAQTFNELVEGEQSRRRELSTIEDTRSPQAKSPVVARLVWTGATLLAPGSTVKLTKSAFDETTDESAPFSGLTFHCEAFADGDQGSPYAISMGPIAAAVTADGTLTTRSDDDTGVLTMDDGMHGIATGDVVDVQWADGSRLAITVGTVAGTTVPIDGGRGDVLPAESTAVTVVRSANVGFGVMPQAYWAKVNLSSATHTTAKRPASGTTLDSAVSAELGILWKPEGTGEKWCVVEVGGDPDSPF